MSPVGPPIDATTFEVFERVTFIDANDSSRQHKALFNPQDLNISVSATVGKLQPIGWSQPIKQYANTGEVSFSVTLEYTAIAAREKAIVFTDYLSAYRFFLSFMYGEQPGTAPSFLVVVWPKTITMLCVVEGLEVNFKRWDTEMNVREFSINLRLTEIGEKFRPSGVAGMHGFRVTDSSLIPGGSKPGIRAAVNQGSPMRLKGKPKTV
jgi:hypothetical protein